MKRLLSKSLGVLLTIIMLVSFIPATSVFADGEEYSVDEVIEMIDELPFYENVTADDYDAIIKARDAYNSLDEDDQIAAANNIDLTTDYMPQYFIELITLCYIDRIPAIDEISLEDVSTIKDARVSFNSLEDWLKDIWQQEDDPCYPAYSKLVASEKKLRELEEADDQAAAAAVIAMIDELPAVEDLTLADKEKVLAALTAYEDLSEHAKTLVTNNLKLSDAEERITELEESTALDEVIAMIKALPDPDDVTVDDSLAITDAWIAYAELRESDRDQVGEELFNKLMDCRYAQARVCVEDCINYSEVFLENYSDSMTEEQIEAIKTNIEAAKKILEEDGKDIDELWEAYRDLDEAVWEPNYEIWKNFTIVEGTDAVYITDSSTGLKFRITQAGLEDWAYELFLDAGGVLLVDGEAVPEDGAKTSKGSLIIELMPDYLKTLSAGDHRLTVKFDNGVTMDIVFTVKAATPVPASGELVSPVVYVGFAIILLAGAGFVVNKKLGKKES